MTIDKAAYADFVKSRLRLTVPPAIPELRLYLATQSSGLGRFLASHGVKRSPYWAYTWGGGLALARYLLDKPDVVSGRVVLDIGTGSGLVAIAAARGGAARVIAVDIDPLAVDAVQLNAEENGVAVEVAISSGHDLDPAGYDIVLAGDVFYDAKVASASLKVLDRFASAGAEVLVGDPGRTHLPRDRLAPVASFAIPDFGGQTGEGLSTVYRLIPQGGVVAAGHPRSRR